MADAGEGSQSTLGRVAASAFIVLHLSATAWWTFGRVGLPAGKATVGDGVIAPIRSAAAPMIRAVDGAKPLSWVLDRYVMLTGSWQSWWMFAPDVPTTRGELAIFGVTAQNRVDPEPIHDDASETYEEWQMRNSHPPCGWGMQGTPRDRALSGMFARHVLAPHPRYVGARYVCFTRPLPAPDGSADVEAVQTWILWQGARQ